MHQIHGGRLAVATAAVTAACALLLGTAAAIQAAPAVAHATRNDRQQAVRKAKEYLSFEAFSLNGLIAQLKFEGFSTGDATYGAKHSGANWFKQAAKKAKEYLKMEAFSFSGMVQQLEFEKFTPAQARYGARAAGL
jgi:hypothetical protein